MARKILLREKARLKLNRHLDHYAEQVLSDWRLWLNNQRRWYQAYRGFLTPRRGVDEGKPNLFIPATGIGVERLHSNFMTSINRPTALLDVQPTEVADTSLTAACREMLRYYFFRKMKMPDALDQALKVMLITGRVTGIMAWDHKRRKRHIPGFAPKTEVGTRRDPRSIARFHFGDQITKSTMIDPNTIDLELLVNQRRRSATLYILTDGERIDPREDEFEYEVEMIEDLYNAPRLFQPLAEDCLVSADHWDVQEAEFVRYQTWRTFQEIRADVDTDYYYGLSDEFVRRLGGQLEKWETGSSTEAENQARAYTEATSGVRTQSALRRTRFCVQKFMLAYDIDDDGMPEEICVTRIVDAAGISEIARIDFLDYISPTGDRPLFKMDWITIPGQPVAIGVPEWIRALQSEVNFIRNNRVLKNEIITNPFGFYAAGSSLNPTTHRIKPGDWIPIDDPRSVYMPAFPQSTGADVLEEQQVQAWIEKMIPIGNTPMGRGGGRETAFGRATLLAQTDEITEKNHWHVGRGIEAAGDLSLGMIGAFAEDDIEFRILGTTELVRLKRGGTVGFDTRCVMNALTGNKAAAQQLAMTRMSLLGQSPLTQSEQRQWQLAADFLESTDYPMPQRLIGTAPDETAHPPLTPTQEHAKFIQGIYSEPTMEDDNEAHIEEHDEFAATQLGQIPLVAKMLKKHREHHIRNMSLAQRQQQMANAPGGALGAGGQTQMEDSMQQSQAGAQQALQLVPPQGMGGMNG